MKCHAGFMSWMRISSDITAPTVPANTAKIR